MTHTNTFTLRLRQSKAIIIALAQGSLPWAVLSVAFICILLLAELYIMNMGFMSRETLQMNLSFLPPFMFFIGACGVMVGLIFTHSALDELRSNFPNYEIMFPVPVGLTVTLHLVYKLLVWNASFYILYRMAMYVVQSSIHNLWETLDYGYGAQVFVIATVIFLFFQQLAWLQHNSYRIFWVFVHLVVIVQCILHSNFEIITHIFGLRYILITRDQVVLVLFCYLLALCYAQVYLQRRGGFSFDIADALSRITLDTGKVKKRTPLWTLVEVQWKAWYQWIFAFNIALCILVVRAYGISEAIAISTVVFIFAGYLTERRDASAMFCGTRPVKDRLLIRARYINALRCAAITLLLFIGLDLMMDWVRILRGSEYIYYSSDEMKLRYLYERFMNTDSKAAIVILYLSIYALTLLCLCFALVAGRAVILIGVFVAMVSLVASVALMPIALFFKSFNIDGVMLIVIVFLQCLLTILSLKQRDYFVLRRYIRRDWIARTMSAALIASLGVTAMIVLRGGYVEIAFFGSFVMLALLVAKQMGTLEKRDALLFFFAALCAILAPLPVVLSFTDNLAQDWIAWSAVLFTGLALLLFCLPITIRWQRVLG